MLAGGWFRVEIEKKMEKEETEIDVVGRRLFGNAALRTEAAGLSPLPRQPDISMATVWLGLWLARLDRMYRGLLPVLPGELPADYEKWVAELNRLNAGVRKYW